MRNYENDGFIAVVIPFFSEVYLDEQDDLADYVFVYRKTYVNTTNGKNPRWYCGAHAHLESNY